MSTLAAQFKALRKESKAEADREVLSKMSLEELANEKVAFGEAKKGCTFEKAFQDTQWTEFILNKYETSKKPEHQMYVKFVELKMQQIKKEGKGLSKMSTAPPVPFDVWEEVQAGEEQAMMAMATYHPVTEEMEDLRQSNQNLSLRMGQIETVMGEILDQVRRLSMVKTED